MEKGRADPLFNSYFWEKIAKVFLINMFTVSAVTILLFLSGLIDEPLSTVISYFQKGYPSFFVPLDGLHDFFRINCIGTVVAEESFYRGPTRILIGLTVFFRKESNWWFMSFIWSVGLVLNYQWASTIHTAHEFAWVPVFVAGTAWLWLVIRTNRLWPSMVSHSLANLSIYFFIKVYQLFV